MKTKEKVEFRKATDDDIFRQALWCIENSVDFANRAATCAPEDTLSDFRYSKDDKKEMVEIAVRGLRHAADTIEGLMKEGYFK